MQRLSQILLSAMKKKPSADSSCFNTTNNGSKIHERQSSIKSIMNFDIKKHNKLIQKIAQPFISKPKSLGKQNLKLFSSMQSSKNSSIQSTLLPFVSKVSIQKYLYNFCFQIGCDLPNQDQMKVIFSLLSYFSTNSSPQNINTANDIKSFENGMGIFSQYTQQQGKKSQFSVESLHLLIQKCLDLYITSKKSNIGGIIDRLIIEIRKAVHEIGKKQLMKKQENKNVEDLEDIDDDNKNKQQQK